MVGDSRGHRENSPSKRIDKAGSNGRTDNGRNGACKDEGDPKHSVARATELGHLDPTQTEALLDLLSRVGVLGFESRRIISVMVANIALEGPTDKRREMVSQLKEYLEGDGLARDLVPVICSAFSVE